MRFKSIIQKYISKLYKSKKLNIIYLSKLYNRLKCLYLKYLKSNYFKKLIKYFKLQNKVCC